MHRGIRILLAAFVTAMAAPQAIAAPCAADTFANYVLLGTCEIGGTVFSDFSVLSDAPDGSTPIDPALVTVNPIVSASDPGLAFVMEISADLQEFFDSLFRFRVTAGAGATLTGSQSALVGAAATGDGAVTLIQDMCLDAVFATPPSGCGGSQALFILFAIEGIDSLSDGSAFVPNAQFVDVVADFGIDGGQAGTAALESATLRFGTTATSVPEPSALALFALGLALLVSLPRTRIGRIRR